MAGLVEAFCLKTLPDTSIEFLTALSEEYRLTLDENLKDDKAHVLRVVVRHLMSPNPGCFARQGGLSFSEIVWGVGGRVAKSWSNC